MIVVENESKLAISCPAVWQALIEFENHAAWNPVNRIEGPAEVGAKIDYVYSSSLLGPRELHVPGEITQLEQGELLEWRVGFRWIFIFTETFTLEPTDYGTHLHHRIEYRSLGATFNRKRAGANSLAMIRKIDAALIHYLAPRPAPARHYQPKGRRTYRK